MSVSLKDQVVIVVGASSGMGRETAVQFAAEGAKVIAVARRQDRLESLGLEYMVADATDVAAMQRMADDVVKKHGRIDILVYATGINIKDRALSRLTPELWDTMVNVNLNGAYYATRAVLPVMREQKAGSIFYISSRSALERDVSGAAYQAAKRGLSGLAAAIRVEEGDNGIRTCVIMPALTDTEIILNRPVPPSREVLDKALQSEDIAEMILAVAKLPARAWVPEVHIFTALVP